MRTSPWIILGSTVILLVVVIVFAVQNSNRERRFMAELLNAKGAALIRAVEAGARTGMTAMGRMISRTRCMSTTYSSSPIRNAVSWTM